MSTEVITAVFGSSPDTAEAYRKLQELQLPADQIRIYGDGLLMRVVTPVEHAEKVVAALAKALRVNRGWPAQESQNWIGHHQGRITQTGVVPGEGDSEAGTTASSREVSDFGVNESRPYP